MEKTTSPAKRLSTILLAFATLLGISTVGSVALAGSDNLGKVWVDKVDEHNAPLAGAHLQIVDANGNVKADFVTEGITAEISLEAGNYQLVEVEAPDGYEIADPQPFEVLASETVTTEIIADAAALPTGTFQVRNEWGSLYGGYEISAGIKAFCVDASYPEAPNGTYTSQPLQSVRGLSADQLLRILYVGYAGDAKGYGSQVRAAEDYSADEQFWFATQYAIIAYTNGEAIAEDYYGKYLGPNRSIANAIKAAANDASIIVPEGYNAYLYTSSGNQPAVAASFPTVRETITHGEPTHVTMMDVKKPEPEQPNPPTEEEEVLPGKAIISKKGPDGALLEGAHLQIIDSTGKVVEEFISTGSAEEFELHAGDYILHEVQAPEGYQVAADVPFTVEAGSTVTSLVPGSSTTVTGTGTAEGIAYGIGSMEIGGAAFAFCVNPQAVFLWESAGNYAYTVKSESQVDFNAFGSKNKKGARSWLNDAPANVGLTPAKMEQVKKVLWATYDYMLTGDVAADKTGIIADTFGNPHEKFAQAGAYLAAEVAIAEIASPGSVNWNLVGDEGATRGNIASLAKALIAAAQGQTGYFAAYAGYSILYLEIDNPEIQNLVVPGSAATEVEMIDEKEEVKKPGKVLIEKIDDTGAYVKGAELQILDSTGRVVVPADGSTFTSTGEAQEFELPVGDYILREVAAPAGYAIADDVAFTVAEYSEEQKTVSVLPSGSVIARGNDDALQWISTDNGSVAAYCLQLSSENPSANGTGYKEVDASAVNQLDSRRTLPNTDIAAAIARVLYAGYGSNATGIVSGLSDYEAQMATAIAVNYFTDYNSASGGQQYGDAVDRGRISSNSKVNSAAKALVAYGKGNTAVPSDFEVKYYAPVSSDYQLLAAGGKIEGQTVVTGEPATVKMVDLKEVKIGTTATDSATKDHIANADSSVTIDDVVAYSGLIGGKEYTLKGELRKKSDSSVITTAERTFTADASGEGKVTLSFTFDGSALKGDSSVAFEKVYDGDELVASHEDINDADQTVDFPEARTHASDGADGDQSVAAGKKVKVVDTVTYTNLIVGKEYTVSGKLMKKSDGQPLVIDGKEVTASTTFTATEKNGSVELTFEFDASALAGEKLVAFEKVTYNDEVVATHEDINDEEQTVTIEDKPEIGTTATDSETEDHIANADEEVTIVDVVAYSGLKAGKEYTLKGELKKKSDESTVATAETTFTAAEGGAGEVSLSFTFDGSALKGDSAVAFEKVYDGEELVASHEDINDADQTVDFPEIRTNAADEADGDKIVKPAKTTKVVDTVTYTNLIVGKEYTVSGKLMKKSDGQPLVIDGKEVTASTTFTAEKKNGTIDIVFEFDASALSSTTLVAFEQLTYKDDVVATHEDITDKDQTVVVSEKPQIGTTATDGNDGDKEIEAAPGQVIVDVVKYWNLEPGKDYTLEGVLMDKSTEQPVYVNGAKVVATAHFTPAEADGEETVEFTFDATEFAGMDVVVYEKLFDANGEQVAKHENINDVGQTVHVKVKKGEPEIGTTATDSATKDHIANADEEVTIVDVVAYTNLTPGKDYTLRGELRKKSDNSVIATNERTFTPEAADGSVTLEFTFDGSKLAGASAVAFEKVFDGEELVASHEDINDADQTVDFPEAKTNATDKADKDQTVAAGKVTIVDKVTYTNLIVGKTYTVSGTLMVKSTGEALEDKGATATKTFKATAKNGSVELEFTIDASSLQGEKLVAFEKVTYKNEVVATHEDLNDEDQTVTVEEKPEIEKYVNKNVHKGITLDEVFTYDVLAYVTKDADKVTITDELVSDLQFVSAAGDVKVVDLGETVDHTPNGSVAQAGVAVANAKAAIDGQKLTVTINPADANRGHWVKVTFDAKIADGKKVSDLKFAKITKNDPVITDEAHEGVPNTASYTIEVGNEGKYSDESNTVTVNPDEPTIGTTATAADGTSKVVAAGEKVIVKDVVAYKNLTPGTTYTLKGKLVTKASDGKTVVSENEKTFKPTKANGSVTLEFTVDTTKLQGEKLVAFEYLYNTSNTLVAAHEDVNDEDQSVDVEKKPEEEKPAIEKYVNKNVHKDIKLDEVFTYDVLAYVTKDADKVVITDELVADLQFASAAGDVAVVDLGTTVDHRPNGSVAQAGTAVKGAKATIDGQTLTVTIDPANANRGHWVKVTFDAKIADGKTIEDLTYATITKNDPVLTNEKHEGVPNKASYAIEVGNEGKYALESNTVTVKPEQPEPELTPEIGTTATDSATKDHISYAATDRTIIDVVAYRDLVGGAEYTLKAKLVDGSGAEIAAAEQKFNAAESGKGTVNVTFTGVDLSALAGGKAVAFEYLYTGNQIGVDVTEESEEFVTKHEDLNDEAQTVVIPEAKTNATDKADGDQTVAPEKVTIVDTVTYTNLIPGKEYTVSGTLMVKSTGKALEAEGATATKTFTAKAANGSVELEFTIDASALAGEKLVAFEKVTYRGEVVATHEDLNDADQTVTVGEKPEIGTVAKDAETKTDIAGADADVTIIDTVTYTNLKPGTQYTLKGELRKKSDSSVITTAERTFTPEAADGSVTLEFTFDGSELAGDAAVAFEKVFEADVLVASHEDITDDEQTVSFPEVKTTATDKDGNKVITSEEQEITIVDVVKYTNLLAGEKYIVRGTLMDKGTGEAIDGATAEKEFTAEAAEGEVELEFTINRDEVMALGGAAVAFEKLFLVNAEGEFLVGTHEDINDGDQTVELTPVTRGEYSFAVAKVDTEAAALAGATLRVVDAQGETVTEWVTDGSVKMIDVPAEGTYTLVEVEAPAGYKLADPIDIVVTAEGATVNGEAAAVVSMVDEKETPGPEPEPTPSASTGTTPPVPTATKTPTTYTTPKVTTTPVRVTTTLPVTGLPRTGAIIGGAGTLATLLLGAGGVLLRKREDATEE